MPGFYAFIGVHEPLEMAGHLLQVFHGKDAHRKVDVTYCPIFARDGRGMIGADVTLRYRKADEASEPTTKTEAK